MFFYVAFMIISLFSLTIVFLLIVFQLYDFTPSILKTELYHTLAPVQIEGKGVVQVVHLFIFHVFYFLITSSDLY
jgi:hypothetical protein